jgi:nucleoside-diphosphate-sugar epimerase
MKILITGSTGFVGRHLLPKILNNGHEVLEITRSISKSTEFFGDKTSKIEINDSNFKEKITDFNPDIVVHLASYLSPFDHWEDIQKSIDANLFFLSKVLNAISGTDLKLFINTGTFAEYFHGNEVLEPAYFYAATKTASRSLIDYYSKAYNFKQVTVVPYSIYGGNDNQKKILDLLFDSLNSDISLDLTLGEQVLDFIHVDDVSDSYILLIKNINKIDNKQVFKLGTGNGHTLRQVVQIIEEITNRRANINWGGKSYRKSDVMYAVADLRSCIEILNWSPKIDLKSGINRMIKVKML